MDKPISLILEMGEVNQLMTRNRISDRIDEQMDVAVPENRERNVELRSGVRRSRCRTAMWDESSERRFNDILTE